MKEKKKFSWQIGCLYLIPILYIISAVCAVVAHHLWKTNPPPPLVDPSGSPAIVQSAAPSAAPASASPQAR